MKKKKMLVSAKNLVKIGKRDREVFEMECDMYSGYVGNFTGTLVAAIDEVKSSCLNKKRKV